LWYVCRALDISSTGYVELPLSFVRELLGVADSTVYRWLKDSKQVGACRTYRIRKAVLCIWLGGLQKLCKILGLSNWGAVATVPLVAVNEKIKALATGITTQDLQAKSRYAASSDLKKRERAFLDNSSADTILGLGGQSSQVPTQGQVPFVVWVGEKRAFVSKSFVPYGASQRSIAESLGVSDRTVRRHQAILSIKKRQLVQAKGAYHLIQAGIEWESDHVKAEPNIWYQDNGGDIRLFEPNGITSAMRTGGHSVSKQRFFRYYGKTWIYRCNLYATAFTLTNMRASRRQYKSLSTKPVDCVANLSTGAGGTYTEIEQLSNEVNNV